MRGECSMANPVETDGGVRLSLAILIHPDPRVGGTGYGVPASPTSVGGVEN